MTPSAHRHSWLAHIGGTVAVCLFAGLLNYLMRGKHLGLSMLYSFMIGAQTRVYEGMIVGEHTRDNDLEVNVVKGKKLTNVRASGKDENVLLTTPMKLTLEKAMA